MSRRNYKAMGDAKLIGCAQNLTLLDDDDQAKVRALMAERGLPIPPQPDITAMNAIVDDYADLEHLRDHGYLDPAGMPIQVQNAASTTLSVDELATEHHWLEAKLDGFRLLAHCRRYGGKVNLWTRAGQRVDDRLPKLTAELTATLPPGTMLDGEICLLKLNPDGAVITGSSYDVQGIINCLPELAAQRDHTLTYVAFDMLYDGPYDLTRLPLDLRRQHLEALHEKNRGRWQHTTVLPTLPATTAAYEQLVAQGWEGAVLKDSTKPYGPGKRGHGFTKFKVADTLDCEIIGYSEGNGKFDGQIGSVLWRDLKTSRTGACSGMDDNLRQWITDHQDDLLGRIIEVAHNGDLGVGWRHPVWRGLRTDRAAGIA